MTHGRGTRMDASLERALSLPACPPSELAALAPAVVLAPHPDDESLGCGGLIAALRNLGAAVRVVAVSDGAGSHPNSRDYPRPRLKAVREGELLAAAAELGLPPRAVTFLGLPDGAVPHPGAPGFALALDRLLGAIGQPRTLLVTWRHDPHPDHQASYHLARAAQERLGPAVRLLEYPIWGWVQPAAGTPGGQAIAGFRLDVRPWLERKRRAIEAHRTQRGLVVRDEPLRCALTPEMIDRFLGPCETFLAMPP